MPVSFSLIDTRGNSRPEYKFYEQLERVLGSSAPSAVPEVTYDVEEVIDEEESQDGDEDLQFLGQTNPLEIGTVTHFPHKKKLQAENVCRFCERNDEQNVTSPQTSSETDIFDSPKTN